VSHRVGGATLNHWLDDNLSVPGTAALLGALLADALVLA
jgi:hypothetical protein